MPARVSSRWSSVTISTTSGEVAGAAEDESGVVSASPDARAARARPRRTRIKDRASHRPETAVRRLRIGGGDETTDMESTPFGGFLVGGPSRVVYA